VNKLVVLICGLLCVVVGAAAFAIVQATEKLSADLHRSAIALDALVARVTAAEEDLVSIADEVGAIADSLVPTEGDDGQGGESVGLRATVASASGRAATVASASGRAAGGASACGRGAPVALARVSRAPSPAAGGR